MADIVKRWPCEIHADCEHQLLSDGTMRAVLYPSKKKENDADSNNDVRSITPQGVPEQEGQ